MILSQRKKGAFTLTEVMISIGIIAVMTALGYAAMTLMNQNAVKARLMTLAEGQARDSVDQFESAGPYLPTSTPPKIPASLATGTTATTLPLYIDPATNQTVIQSTRTITVANTNNGTNVLSMLVTISYTYHGRTYQVQMNSLRASDT